MGRASSNPEVRALLVRYACRAAGQRCYRPQYERLVYGSKAGAAFTPISSISRRRQKNLCTCWPATRIFYMSGIFNSEYWAAHGGELPGWIVGTAGAVRYAFRPDAARAKKLAPRYTATCWAQSITMGKLILSSKRSRNRILPLPSASAIRHNSWISASTKTRHSLRPQSRRTNKFFAGGQFRLEKEDRFFQAAPNNRQLTTKENQRSPSRRMHFFVDNATSVPQYLVCKHPTVNSLGFEKVRSGSRATKSS